MTEEQEKQLVDDLLKIVHMGASDTATPEMAMAGVEAAETLIKVIRLDLKWLRTIGNANNAQTTSSAKLNINEFIQASKSVF